ncbi:MAG: nucleotidyl transferase AbiEii/AbiGii toxin family protein [Anaerolineae bacterium]|nr:nucleotidyl transferase AbiEii/AbiGii toxin family protein [Anaerolineae bacterium]
MIGLPEVQRLAYRAGVSARMIERDYVLTWALIGLARHPALGAALALKGGTALKKVYFADWRYSEDLDFTAQQIITPEVLLAQLSEIAQAVGDEAGIELVVASSEPREDGGRLRNVTVYLGYVGPLHRTRRRREFKLDFTFDEVMVNPPVRRSLLSAYSDEPRPVTPVLAYSLEEIGAEKLRTLLQRTQPRDLYDVWRLLVECGADLDLSLAVETFRTKCLHKGLTPESLAQALAPAQVGKIRRAWASRLENQMADVPSLEQVMRETRRALRVHLALRRNHATGYQN